MSHTNTSDPASEGNRSVLERCTAETPTAVEILPTGADDASWLRTRREGLGGSDALAVLGLSPYTSRYRLYLDKIGELPPVQQTFEMELGKLLEPVIAELFTRRTGINLVRPAGTFAHVERPWQLANPDGFSDDGGIVEFKTTTGFSDDGEMWEAGEVPDHCECQIQHYLEVTGRSHGWAVGLITGPRRKLHIYKVERDESFGSLLTAEESRFWFDHVQRGVAPAPDGSQRTKKLIGRRYRQVERGQEVVLSEVAPDLLSEHHDAKAAYREAETRFTEIENLLKLELGNAEFGLGPDGARLVHWRKQSRTDIDRTRLKTEHPEVYADVLVKDETRVFVNKLPKLPESGDQ